MANENDIQNGVSEHKLNLAERVGGVVKTSGSAVQKTGTAVKYSGQITEKTGTAVKQTGKGVEYTGKGASVGGRAMIKAGAGMSETAVGAVVGVPLAVVGGAVYGAGKGVEYTGKGVKNLGKGVEKTGSLAKKAGVETNKFGGTLKKTGQFLKNQASISSKDTNKISTVTSGLMILVAVTIDIFQFLVGFLDVIFIGTPINWGISTCTWLLFYIWFKTKGVDFAKPKRALSFGAGFLIKLIPIINMLPAWTFVVLVVIGTTKAKKMGHPPGITAALSAAKKARSI